MRRSSRDPDELRAALERWLRTVVPDARELRVSEVRGTDSTGMSSDTLIFDAGWDDGIPRPLVARVAPRPEDVPVFPTYDLDRQFRLLQAVARHTVVPVPEVHWFEADPRHLGAPFFIMSRVDGVVPPDVMPYTFGDNWLFDAARSDQERLERATVGVLAELHGMPLDGLGFLALDEPGETPLRRHVAHTRAWYDFAVTDSGRSPLLERGFAWLEDHWPEDESDPVVCWGDARIGNVLYDDFEPVAVLDWEMASLGPRELDVAWLVFAHMVFESLAGQFELPGMPHFLRPERVIDIYESFAGVRLAPLDWYLRYAAIQWGIVFLRTSARAVHFGEAEPPAHPDDPMHHRELLARLLD